MTTIRSILVAVVALTCFGCASQRISTDSHRDESSPHCAFCGTTLHGGHSHPEAPVYIGTWQFISADGDITSGKWWHQKIVANHDFDPLSFVREQKDSGVLLMWWDTEKKHPYWIEEWLDGKRHGYTAQWDAKGQLRSLGILRNESWQTVTWFESSGEVSTAWVRKDNTDEGIQSVNIGWSPADIAARIIGAEPGSLVGTTNSVIQDKGAPTMHLEPISGSQ